MNIVERKRRLQREALENLGGDATTAASALDEISDGEATDGYESEDPDVFERTKKFEKLLRKFNQHREKNVLTLKGNDLRYNVYLRKLEKLTRNDLGLDVIAYKDYVNNLKEFANINSDLNAFALESLAVERAMEDRDIITARIHNDYTRDHSIGIERVATHKDSISFTLAKLQRTGSGYLNERDKAAYAELTKHIELYMLNDSRIFDQLSIIYKHQ